MMTETSHRAAINAAIEAEYPGPYSFAAAAGPMMQRTHDGPPFPIGTNETPESLARGYLAAAYAEPTDLAECARCYATVPDRLDLHWDDELGDEVCPDCCPECNP